MLPFASCFGFYFWDDFKFELDHSNEQQYNTLCWTQHHIRINVHLLLIPLLLCCRQTCTWFPFANLIYIHTQKRESHRIWHWSMVQWTLRGTFASNSKCSWIWKSTVGTEWHPINHIRFLASPCPHRFSLSRFFEAVLLVASIARSYANLQHIFHRLYGIIRAIYFVRPELTAHNKKKRTVIYGCGCYVCTAQAHKTPNIFVRATLL